MRSSVSWWQDAIIYELYVDKFAGDFRGLTEQLDYFVKLGVNTLHILPHYPSPLVDDGYDISDYRAVSPTLGNMEDFKRFTETAHAKGIRVLIELVLNHVSEEHSWFIDARSSRTSPYREYFLWSETGTEFQNTLNPFVHLKPRNWIYDEQTNEFYFATFYPQQPDLNWRNPKVYEEMVGILDFWVAAGVDAFRLDAAPHLIKAEGELSKGYPETHQILKRLRAHLDVAYDGSIALLGEAQDPLEQTAVYFGEGDECQLLYNFPRASKMLYEVWSNDVSHEDASLTVMPPRCAWVHFLRNHDSFVLRFLSLEQQEIMEQGVDLEGRYSFRGEGGLSMRLADILGGDSEKIQKAQALLFAQPGALSLYYGDEIGMRNDTAIGTPKDTRRYVRGAFDWVEAERQMTDPDSLFSFVAKLANDRASS